MKKLKSEKEIGVSFHTHKSAKSLIYLYYALPPKASLDTEVPLDKFLPGCKKGPVRNAISAAKEIGYWGFCRKVLNKNESSYIHYWVDESKDALDIIHLLAHEVTHSTGIISEFVANRTAAIASFALYVTSLRFKNKLKLSK